MNVGPEPAASRGDRGDRDDGADAADVDPTDRRMAELLSGTESLQRMRQELRQESGAAADDLLGRLHALEFVGAVVGEELDLPDRLGDYRITGLLGRGGMGAVYAAYQESLEREVALKVLSPALSADPTMRQRFRSEARAIAMLHHPHIVPIFDYGEAGGLMYFAMEKIDGVSLDKHILASRRAAKRLMEPREAVRRFAGVADALGHAHKRRLLHRDVKPGNLLVARDGTLSLVDFGLSKALGEASMRLTTGGAFLGTLLYAAPEQALGRELSASSDLYSLGVTLFEAVTGELPLHGKTTESMLEALLNGTPRRLRELDPKAPRDLDAVLEKLLSREPSDRYDDGEALSRDLMRIADGEPVRIRRQPMVVRVARRVRKNPGMTAALALSILSFATSAVLWRGRVVEHDRLMASNRQQAIQSAMDEATREAGAACGPPGLMRVLVGDVEDAAADATKVLDYLAEAERVDAKDGIPAAIRAAYRAPVDPDVLTALSRGDGLAALRTLEPRIQAATTRHRAGDDPAVLTLYVDYVARAIANLTPAVGRPEAARFDLVRAGMLRQGAFFPQLLDTFLDWRPASGPESLIAKVTEQVERGPVGAARAAGRLMLHFAGIQRSPDAHCIDVPMSYGHRRTLHAAAVALLGGTPPGTVAGPVGVEATIAAAVAKALPSVGDTAARERILGDSQRLLRDRIDPASPLQCWNHVLAILRRPEGAEALLADGTPMPDALQVDAWVRFLRLAPGAEWVRRGRASIDALLARTPESSSTAELRGLVAHAVGRPEDLLDAANRWLAIDPDHPEPLLLRMLGCARAGDLERARFAAVQARQTCADWSQCRDRLLALLDEFVAGLAPLDAEPWLSMREAFANL